MATKPLTTREFFKQFPDDEACLAHLFRVRFGQGFECPSCARPSNWYRIKAERAYSCQWCGYHLHPTVGTPYEQTRTPLQLWFYATHLFTTTRQGVSAKELERQLGVTYKTAWRIAKLIREHMAAVDGEAPIRGPGTAVEVDETLVGGVKRGKHMRGASGQVVVMGMMERGGDIMAKVVPNQRRATLRPIVKANLLPGGELHTDELNSYAGLHTAGYRHMTVNHGARVRRLSGRYRELDRRVLASPKAQHSGDAREHVREAPERLRQRVRVPLQPLERRGFDVAGASFNVRAIEAKARLSAVSSPGGVSSASRSAMKPSRSPSASALRSMVT